MFYFNNPQTSYEIDGVTFGGQSGENPTVLFGGIRKINNENQSTLKEQLLVQEKLSQELGVLGSVDLFVRKETHVQKRIDFAVENINGPFLLDLPSKELKLKQKTLEYISQQGLQEKIIYNSINFATSEEEIALLQKYKIKSAILLAVDMANLGTDGSLSILKEKLIPHAKKAGIENMLVDPGTMAFNNDNIAGEILRSIQTIKSETGLPTGCAMINIAESWDYFKSVGKDIGYQEVVASLNSSAQLMGADFLLYGPLKMAPQVFPSAAAMDKLCAEANKKYFDRKSNIK